MTTQKAYERIREYFSRPGAEVAWDDDLGSCAYRVGKVAESSTRCAIGCLIPDSLYRKKFDDGETTPDEVIAAIPSFRGVDAGFLLDAQDAHDNAAGYPLATKVFLARLDEVALNHSLAVVAA